MKIPAVNKGDAYQSERSTLLRGFGANVRRLRTAKDPPCSQEQLSYETRLHRTEIGRIEQGQVEPRLATLMILADGLNVTVAALVADLPAPRERKPAARGGGWR